MNRNSVIDRFVSAAATTAKVIFMVSLLSLVGCDDGKYNVILAVDSREYRPGMTWDEIRESGFKKPYSVQVFDANEHPVPLYRYNHDDGRITPLDKIEIHISTPLIIEKKYDTLSLSVFDHGNEVTKIRVVIRDLKAAKGGPKAYVTPVELPVKHP